MTSTDTCQGSSAALRPRLSSENTFFLDNIPPQAKKSSKTSFLNCPLKSFETAPRFYEFFPLWFVHVFLFVNPCICLLERVWHCHLPPCLFVVLVIRTLTMSPKSMMTSHSRRPFSVSKKRGAPSKDRVVVVEKAVQTNKIHCVEKEIRLGRNFTYKIKSQGALHQRPPALCRS